MSKATISDRDRDDPGDDDQPATIIAGNDHDQPTGYRIPWARYPEITGAADGSAS